MKKTVLPIKSNKKRATLQEFANYFGMSKPTIISRLKEFNKTHPRSPYDSYNIYSVFQFVLYLLKIHQKKSMLREE